MHHDQSEPHSDNPGVTLPRTGSSEANAASSATSARFSTLRRKLMPWLQILGLLLVIAAVWYVFQQPDLLTRAWTALKAQPWQMIALLLALPLVNWLLSAILFWVLTRQFAKITLSEMTMLIGSAWLLNVLPMRPGLLTRVAYQSVVHKMSMKQNLIVVVYGSITTLLSIVIVVFGLLITLGVMRISLLPSDAAGRILGATLLLLTAAIAIAAWMLATSPKPSPTGVHGQQPRKFQAPIATWRVLTATVMRMIDFASWTVRYYLAFAALGKPIDWSEASAVAIVSLLVGLLPVQMGPREWAVGLISSVLPSFRSSNGAVGGSAITSPASGLTVDLFNRALELAVSLPIGLVCTWMVSRRLKQALRARENSARAK